MSESEAPLRMPSMEQAFALAKRAVKARNKAIDDYQPVKDQEAAFYENGNGNPKQQALIKRLIKARDKNEMAALQEAALYEQAIEYFVNDTRSRGHVGDFVEMAARPGADAEPQSAAAAAAEAFEREDAETEANRAAARAALDLPEDGSAAAPPPPPVVDEKPKRGGRKPKAVEAVADAVPPPPPAPTLKDDDDEFEAAAPERVRGVGTFAVVH